VEIDSVSGDVTVFSVRGEPNLGDELRAVTEMVAGDVGTNVVIDLAGVDIVRSSSLTKLLKLRQALVARNRQMVLCNVHPLTQSIMEITDLNTVFTITPDKQAAISLIHNSRFTRV
jgi:anti-anti-sigma factor